MTSIRTGLCLLSLLLPGTGATANELNDYLKEAAKNNPGLEASFHRWKAALEQIPQIKALPDPKFTYTYYIEQVETRVGPQEQLFGIAQTFPWLGKLKLKETAASEAAEAARQRYEQDKLNLFYRVKSTYFEYSYLAQAIDITKQHLILLQNIEEVSRARFKSGASQSAAVQAQVEIGKTEDRLRTLEALRLPLSANLNATLNRPQNSIIPWPQPPEPTRTAFTDAQAQQNLVDFSPELQQYKALIREGDAAVKLAKKARQPDVTLGLSYIQTADARMPGVSDSGNDPFMISVSINLPIWRSKLKAGEREAAHLRLAEEQQLSEAENRLAAALLKALFKFRDAERKVSLYRDSLVPKAEQALQVTRTNFESGGVSFTTLMDAERALLEFQLSLSRSLADREIHLAEIEILTGGNVYP